MAPFVLLASPREQCLTFFWHETPAFYVGYRLIEYLPQTTPVPCTGYELQPRADWGDLPIPAATPLVQEQLDPLMRRWQAAYREPDQDDPIQLEFQAFSDGSAFTRSQEQSGAQQREMFFRPEADGVRMWLRVTTREPIPGAYALQQCLRFTGRFNAPWRGQIAHIPLLSELDMQAAGRPNATLSFAMCQGDWYNFPVAYTLLPTLAGQGLAGETPAALDHGLVLRESPHHNETPGEYWTRIAGSPPWPQISAGMYWERTAAVSNRHPADCLHSLPDFGPLEAGQSRTLRGKFYWIEGSKQDLLAAWQRDFRI